MAAIEFAVLVVFLIFAVIFVSRQFVKHSRRGDPVVKTLDLIFFKDPKKNKGN